MKKMNAILAAITLAVTAITPLASSAIEVNFANGRDKMTVSKEFEASYELEIPDTDLYTLVEGEGFDVTATAFLHVYENMIVSVESKNDWYIEDTECDTNQIKYDVKVEGEEDIIQTKKADIMTVTSGDNKTSKTVKLNIEKIHEADYAGTYTDQLTFSARAVDVPKTEEEKVTTATEAQETTPTTSSEEEKAPATTTTETTSIADGGGDNEGDGNNEV